MHTTVSAEAIRFALRRHLSDSEPCNRTYDEDGRVNHWQDPKFDAAKKGNAYIDDDLLGYMSANAAKDEQAKGSADVRRAVLEITRAVSLTPWTGDVTFNAASPGATPSAQKGKVSNPVPYATEMHATRYQYGFALTPKRLRKPGRAQVAVRGLCGLGPVAGNQGRFLYDFSPDSVILRLSEEAAPRILYAFESDGEGRVSMTELVRKVRAGDILAAELVIGGRCVQELMDPDREALLGAQLFDGVRAACEAACHRIGEATA